MSLIKTNYRTDLQNCRGTKWQIFLKHRKRNWVLCVRLCYKWTCLLQCQRQSSPVEGWFNSFFVPRISLNLSTAIVWIETILSLLLLLLTANTTMQDRTIQYSTVQYNTIQYNNSPQNNIQHSRQLSILKITTKNQERINTLLRLRNG